MEKFKIIAFTHKSLELKDLGKLHVEENEICNCLQPLKIILGIGEIMMISTCNRVEFLLSWNKKISKENVEKFLQITFPFLDEKEFYNIISSAVIYENEKALDHLFNVASSLDSLVVGEREIITQVRNAYELCHKLDLTGDLLRLVIQKTIECAKEVYTKTNIANKPISVVSLAYRKLKELHVKSDAKFLIIGSGVTNSTMGKYLKKHGLSNFVVFNRTLSNGEKLAKELGGKALQLEELKNYKAGFDVIVTCTGSSQPIITKEIYSSLVGNDKSKKIIVDLAVPRDIDEEVQKHFDVNFIGVSNLKTIAEQNLRYREKEMDACKKIIERHIAEFHKMFKERKVELAMSDVPKKVKEIYDTAMNEVFAKDIEKLDVQSKGTLDKVIAYLEKKYISMPMKMAKEILIDEVSSK